MTMKRSQPSGQKPVASSSDDVLQQQNGGIAKRKDAASLLLLIALLCCSVPAPVAAIRGALFRSGRSPAALSWLPVPISRSAVVVGNEQGGAGAVPPFLITSEQLINNKAQPPVMVDLRQLAQWQREQAMVAGAVKQMLEENNRQREEAALEEMEQNAGNSGTTKPTAHIRFSIPALFGIPTRHFVASKRAAGGDWQIVPPAAASDQQQQLIKRGKQQQQKKWVEAGDEQQQQQQKKQQQLDLINMAKKFMISYNRDGGARRRR
ncbi:hypothetical protein niasHT_022971 [Heterodera trifolii]|uniref:Uncharacterized protein n=1 Tax=Heterodera trifolii TaxID=157864 RepID=A0ABD2KPU3_9BILA